MKCEHGDHCTIPACYFCNARGPGDLHCRKGKQHPGNHSAYGLRISTPIEWPQT